MKGFHSPTSRLVALVVASAALLGAPVGARGDLVINAVFDGGAPPPNIAGGGDLGAIFNTAISYWEAAFKDPNDQWVVNLHYQWGTLDPTLNGQFYLATQGGVPHRIESGSVVFNNTGSIAFFADPTPRDNSEYKTYTTTQFDTPEGPLITSRLYSGATGDAAGRVDLLSIAAHEIGHALGLSQDNTGAMSPIVITPPLPFAGVDIPSFGTDHLNISGALMGPLQGDGMRFLISPVDVLVEAQIGRFAHPNLDPYAVPEPGTLGLMLAGLVALATGAGASRTKSKCLK